MALESIPTEESRSIETGHQTVPEPISSTPVVEPRRRPGMWVFVLMFLAHLPFVLVHFQNLYEFRPHYEFVPFVIVAVVALLWNRWPQERCEHSRFTRFASWSLLFAGLLAMAAGVLLFSPVIGTVAAILNLGGVLLLLTGRTAWRTLLPVWLLLWLIIPPPRRLDESLIRFQQSTTSEISHKVLNWVGVLHQRSGNVFQLPDRELFVAEACSGVHSQLVLLAVGALLCVIEKRSWLHSLILIPSAFLWSVLANSLRVTMVVYAAAEWEMDLATGWQHEVLGYSLIFIGFIGLLSTDQLLIGFLGPIPLGNGARRNPGDAPSEAASNSAGARIDNRLYGWWNRFIAMRDTPLPRFAEISANQKPKPRGVFQAAATGGLALIALLLLPMAAAQTALVVASRPKVEIKSIGMEDLFEEESMPSKIGDWSRATYEQQERDRSSQEGQFSHLWGYNQSGAYAQISMDFPFIGWHHLPGCYEGRGWRMDSTDVRGKGDDQFWEVTMSKPTGERAVLLFSLYHSNGSAAIPDDRTLISRKLLRSPLLQILQGEREIGAIDTTTQYQCFQVFGGEITDADREDMRKLFLDSRSLWKNKWLTTIKERGDG